MSDGRIRGTPIVVSLEDAEWLFRDKAWAIIGPDPEDECDLAEWLKGQEPSERKRK